jgi:hypothetical protein
MKKYLQKHYHVNKIRHISENNRIKLRLGEHEICLLYGSGPQSKRSDYKFYNTYGKDFSGTFKKKRLEILDQTPDSPIDMKFMESMSEETRHRAQPKCP